MSFPTKVTAPVIPEITRAIEKPSASRKPITHLWWLTGVCLALALGLGGWSWFTRGVLIHIQFREGHGLRAENRLMHRGIEVGVVERVRLETDLGKVDVVVRLNDSASALARKGSRFWIERPIASIQGVRSLETILSGRYIAVEPGPESDQRQVHFQGLEEPPQPSLTPGALEVILEANDRHGLQVNAPVIYRGLEVGCIQSVGLSADSRWVQVRAMIEEDYRTLVRENSRFWNRSGLRIDLGLSGVEIDAESLSTIAIGGIEFATPDPPGSEVKTGRRFELASKADDDWSQWRPRLLYGAILPQGQDVALSPIRLSRQWQERLFGFRKKQSRDGWMLMLSDGSFIGPSDLFSVSEKAIENSTRWETAGVEIKANQWIAVDPSVEKESSNHALSTVPISRRRIQDFAPDAPQWPVDRLTPKIDTKNLTERLWIACDVPSRWIPVEAHQLTPAKIDGWVVDPSVGLSENQHGAPVFDSQLAQVIGFIVIEQRVARIVSSQ
jgi:paraquat-inducible protein B